MKFVLKFFPEITIKSRPVRKQIVRQLRDNLRKMMAPIDKSINVQSEWDRMTVECACQQHSTAEQIIEVLSCTPGIANFLDVQEYPFVDMQDAYEKTYALWGQRIKGKTFAVRCKRFGKHDFTSHDLEVYIGAGLDKHGDSAGVDLRRPEVTVLADVQDDRLFIVNHRYEGLGGFPLGSIDSVVSLMSGGFDSTVASYMTMKRGLRTHFCFFSLGGRDHEIGVKEVALYLWLKYGSSTRVKFVTVPFEGVVAELLKNVTDSQMGVVLKRMMLRAGASVAGNLSVKALVTGEAVSQVSSQTLTNLTVIDAAIDMVVLRPLIVSNKADIISLARQIGTEEFAAAMPEYCGVISVKPTTGAQADKIEAQEGKFDFAVLEQALADATYTNIDQIAEQELSRQDVEVLTIPIHNSVIIDIRHPTEQERKPLLSPLRAVPVQSIPFFQLHKKFAELDPDKVYLLYCDRGAMSRLHGAYLAEQGYENVKVYRP